MGGLTADDRWSRSLFGPGRLSDQRASAGPREQARPFRSLSLSAFGWPQRSPAFVGAVSWGRRTQAQPRKDSGGPGHLRGKPPDDDIISQPTRAR